MSCESILKNYMEALQSDKKLIMPYKATEGSACIHIRRAATRLYQEPAEMLMSQTVPGLPLHERRLRTSFPRDKLHACGKLFNISYL